jgi:methionyl-tRNA formyltransferase
VEFDAAGLFSVCIQHEMDHLDGKVFVEYLSKLKRDVIKRKMLRLKAEDQDLPVAAAGARLSRPPMSACRVVFLGTPAFAVPSLIALAERPDLAQVVAAVTQPDKPAGRGRKLTACPVKIAAEARKIPVFQFSKMKVPETREALADLQADLFVVAAYGRILPPGLLSLPRLGCVNVHASLLPRHRGASPIAHAILAGDAEAGVGIMAMDEGLDTGPVYSHRALPIAADDTCGSLTVKLAELGAALLIDTLPGLFAGSARPTPQPADGITYAPLLSKAAGALDFSAPAATLARQVRAFDPWPGTFAYRGETRVGLLVARPAPEARGAPGTVLEAGGRGVLVACGEGGLWLDTV